MREQREREQQVWQEAVKPSLEKARKPSFRLANLRTESTPERKAERRFLWIAGLSVFLVLLVLAVSSAPLVVIAFLLAILLAYAYASGRHQSGDLEPRDGDAPEAPAVEGEPDS
jgi:Flp pilus assembly protein TadB